MFLGTQKYFPIAGVSEKDVCAVHTMRNVKPCCFSYASPSENPVGLKFFGKRKKENLRWSRTQTRPYISRMSDSSVPIPDSSGDAGFNSVAPAYAEIIVVRHGETLWNADGRIQGHLDVELNEVGRQQAAAVADRLSKESKISAVYSSDLKRALETAQIIANNCGALEVIQEPELRERHLGDLQGLVFAEASKLKREAYQVFISPRRDQEIPGGGESRDQFSLRCTSALQRIGSKHKGERVVVVTHGGVLRALHKRAAPKGRQGKIMNTSVNIFHLSDGEEWNIRTWGDVSHLSETGFLKTAFGGDGTSG